MNGTSYIPTAATKEILPKTLTVNLAAFNFGAPSPKPNTVQTPKSASIAGESHVICASESADHAISKIDSNAILDEKLNQVDELECDLDDLLSNTVVPEKRDVPFSRIFIFFVYSSTVLLLSKHEMI